MSAPEWYSWYWRAWRESRRARGMTWEERGVYRELLDEQFVAGPLPADPAVIARAIGAPRALVARVLAAGFEQGDDGCWRNARMVQEASESARRTMRMRDQRRQAARARWAKSQGAAPERTVSDPDASRMRTASEPESGSDAQGQGQGQGQGQEQPGVPRAPRAATRIRQTHAWHRHAAFTAVTDSWPASKRTASLEAAFAAWEGLGDEGKRRVAEEVRRERETTERRYLPQLGPFVVEAARTAERAPANGTAHLETCDYCHEKFSTDNGVLTIHRRTCAPARKVTP